MLAAYRAAINGKQSVLPLYSSSSGSILFNNNSTVGVDSLYLYYSNVVHRLAIGSITSANNLIQLMTGYNIPSPQIASASSAFSASTPAYYAFNNTTSIYNQYMHNGWVTSASPSSPQWLQINMGANTAINSYSIQCGGGNVIGNNYNPTCWVLQGSSNGTAWTSLDSEYNQTGWSSYQLRSFSLSNIFTYQYYRLLIYGNQGSNTSISVYTGIGGLSFYNSTTTHGTPLAKEHVFTSTLNEKGVIIQGAAAQAANLSEWQNSSSTVLTSIDASGNVNTIGTVTATGAITSSSTVTGLQFNSTATKTTLSGTSGNAIFCQPLQGSSSKEVIIYCNALSGATTTYTFPSAFAYIPAISTTNGLSSSVVTTLTTTGVAITGSTSTGYIILKGL